MVLPTDQMDHYLATITTMALCASCFVIFSPMGSMFKIMRYGASGKEIMGLLVPYFMLFAQCYLWSWYGILLQNPNITRINILGTTMCLMYLWIMSTYAAPKDRQVMRPMVSLAVCMVVMLSIGIAGGFPSHRRIELFSNVATLFCILLNVAPMVQIMEVVKTRSTEGFPVALTVAGFISSSLWAEYSIVINAIPYLIPNLLGIIMNGVQIGVVCWVYVKFGMDQMEADIMPLMQTAADDGMKKVKGGFQSFPAAFTKAGMKEGMQGMKESLHNFTGFKQQMKEAYAPKAHVKHSDTGGSAEILL